ncbi:hypothetical protein D3C87_1653880 [compost metagenome]
MGEPVSTRDQNWLIKYDEAIAAGTTLVKIAAEKAEERRNSFMKKAAAPVESQEAGSEEESAEASEETSEEMTEEGMEMMSEESLEGSEDDELQDAIEKFDNDEDMEVASDDSLFSEEENSEDEEELPFLGEADDIDEEGGINS